MSAHVHVADTVGHGSSVALASMCGLDLWSSGPFFEGHGAMEMATRKMDPCGHVKTDPLTRSVAGKETSPTTAPSVRQSVPSFLWQHPRLLGKRSLKSEAREPSLPAAGRGLCEMESAVPVLRDNGVSMLSSGLDRGKFGARIAGADSPHRLSSRHRNLAHEVGLSTLNRIRPDRTASREQDFRQILTGIRITGVADLVNPCFCAVVDPAH